MREGPPESDLRSERLNNRGFTLVEILVVVAIIAVLIVLLVPAAQTMSASGRTAKCASNLRQIGNGYALFSAENNGEIPFAWDYGMSAVAEIGPYINVPGWWSMLRGEKAVVSICPADDKGRPDGWPSYAFNIHLGDSRDGPRRKRASFATPSKICVAGDGRGDLFLIDSQERNSNPAGASFQWQLRHGGGANVLFLDGHVELMKPPFPYGATEPFWH